MFPYVVKRGSAVVKVYRSKSRGRIYFKVVFYDAGHRRKTIGKKSFTEAKTEAELIACKIEQGEISALELTNADRVVYGRATAAVKPFGVPLDVAAEEYARARQQLGTASLTEASSFYVKHHPRDVPRKTVQEVVAEFLDAQRGAGLSEVYIGDLKYRCQTFANAFPCAITELTRGRIHEFLSGLKRRRTFKGSEARSSLSKRSYNNFRSVLRTLFDFAKRRRYVPRDFEEMEVVERVKNAHSEIEIFSAAEMALLLAHADKMIPFIAIGGFAGLRHAELKRLDWREVDLQRDFIEVTKGKAKTAARRLIPVQPNLKAWLLPWRRESGPVCPVKDSNWQLKDIASAAGVKWKHNALRHSFISYRVAAVQDVAKIALEAGNSPQVIFSNYRELVRPDQAAAWFAIFPPTVENIVPLQAARL